MHYRVGNIILDSEIDFPSYEQFKCAPSQPDVSLRLSEGPICGLADVDVNAGSYFVQKAENGWFFHPKDCHDCGLLADRSYSDLKMIRGSGMNDITAALLLRTALECRLAKEGYISLHAACVRINDHTVAFTGHSTLGKSTRAAAAIEAYNGTLLSGDRPFINTIDKTANGVPWDGKEACFLNASYPLDVIFDIRRSPEPYVRELSPDQKLRLLSNQCFYALWDTDTAVIQMINVRRMIRNIPILRLFCGPTAQDIIAAEKVVREGSYLPPSTDLHTGIDLSLMTIQGKQVLAPRKEVKQVREGIALNDVGAFIWRQLVPGNSREDILRAVCNEFDVPADRASEDLEIFLNRLSALNALAKK